VVGGRWVFSLKEGLDLKIKALAFIKAALDLLCPLSKKPFLEDIRGVNERSPYSCGFPGFLCSDCLNIYVHPVLNI